jgi:hypothetical protein
VSRTRSRRGRREANGAEAAAASGPASVGLSREGVHDPDHAGDAPGGDAEDEVDEKKDEHDEEEDEDDGADDDRHGE